MFKKYLIQGVFFGYYKPYFWLNLIFFKMDSRILIILGIVTSSWIITSYYDYAIQKGLPVGKFFQPGNGIGFKLFALIAGLYFSIAGAIDFGWYYILIIPLVSFFLAFLLVSVLKMHAQLLSIVGLFILILVNILMQTDVVSI